MQDISHNFLTLQGGPLHRLGLVLGLVKDNSISVYSGIAIGGCLWIVLVTLAFFEGGISRIFTLESIGGHTRLLIVIPLFFLCESILNPTLNTFVDTLIKSNVVPQPSVYRVNRVISHIVYLNNGWLPDIACFTSALVLAWVSPSIPYLGTTSSYGKLNVVTDLPFTTIWYISVCLTVFRFLMFRWLWKLALWCYFLWQLSRLDLKLIPTHPDGVGGLGYLELVHIHFSPLVVAVSVIQSATLAEEIVSESSGFEIIFPTIGFILLMDALLFLGPLFFFSGKLWATKVKGLSEYSEFAAEYVNRFDEKWVHRSSKDKEPILGSSDIQSLADLEYSVKAIREMRWAPVSLNLVKQMIVVACLPFIPLLLLRYPVNELAVTFFSRLTGL